jgi:hypothetical protein
VTDRYRLVEADGNASALEPLEANENAFRIKARLDEAAYRRIAAQLEARPDAWLWIDDNGPDVEALVHFPGLRNLQVHSLRLESWSGLRHVAESLEQLFVTETTMKPISIAPFRELTRLKALYLTGPVRDTEAIGALTNLDDLTLRSVTLSDLSLLQPMGGLRSLGLLLGGTSDLSLLPALPALEELELWRIRGLRDVSVLGTLPNLQRLHLQSMSAITELPSLAGCTALRRLVLDTMTGITDLAPVAAAPALEELLLIGMVQLGPESLRPLIGHPTLRRGIWGFGSRRRNEAAYDLLPLDRR